MTLIGVADEVYQARVRQSSVFQVARRALLHLSPWTPAATGLLWGIFGGVTHCRCSEQIHAGQPSLGWLRDQPFIPLASWHLDAGLRSALVPGECGQPARAHRATTVGMLGSPSMLAKLSALRKKSVC